MLTYKRRPQSNGLKRNYALLDDENDVGANGEKDCGKASLETSPAIDNWRTLMGPKKTVAPRRIVGQYFLDLGQSDFSYSTCPTCGLFYARGQENDEKVHKTFHKNRIQGIQFKGWQNERILSKLDDSGNRVILVLTDDSNHQSKVKEVIDVMEVELGLTPGWLLQRSCKVYLYISSSKKIVGCLMAEPIKSAFRVVNPQSQGSGGVETSKYVENEGEPLIQGSKPSRDGEDSIRNQFAASAAEFRAAGNCKMSLFAEEKQGGLYERSNSLRIGERVVPMRSHPTGASSATKERISAAKKEVLSHQFDHVKEEPLFIKDKVKIRKITEFFTRKSSNVKDEIDCKSEWDATYSKADINDASARLEMDVNRQDVHNYEQHKKVECMKLEQENKVCLDSVEDSLSEGHKVKNWASGTNPEAREGDSRRGCRLASNVMVFGNVKFSREMASRKRSSQNQTQDLGRAILYSKAPESAVCGVRVIWVSQSERRKGIASHLLDTMRYSLITSGELSAWVLYWDIHKLPSLSPPQREGNSQGDTAIQANS